MKKQEQNRSEKSTDRYSRNLVSEFAKTYFTTHIENSRGKTIGYSYFKEGF
jgi:hypothetical protein